MNKEYLEVKDLQANFIKCFNELLTKTDKDIIVVNISREMAQDMVNLYEKYLTINPSKALKNLDKVNDYLNNVYDYKEIKEEIRKDIDTIKYSLLRLDHLDDVLNVPPNRFSCINNREIIVMRTEMFEKYLEQEKVLKIIKKKQVDICELKICIDEYDDSLYQYNKRNIEQFKLTQEEFDLLKRYCDEIR